MGVRDSADGQGTRSQKCAGIGGSADGVDLTAEGHFRPSARDSAGWWGKSLRAGLPKNFEEVSRKINLEEGGKGVDVFQTELVVPADDSCALQFGRKWGGGGVEKSRGRAQNCWAVSSGETRLTLKKSPDIAMSGTLGPSAAADPSENFIDRQLFTPLVTGANLGPKTTVSLQFVRRSTFRPVSTHTQRAKVKSVSRPALIFKNYFSLVTSDLTVKKRQT